MKWFFKTQSGSATKSRALKDLSQAVLLIKDLREFWLYKTFSLSCLFHTTLKVLKHGF